MDVPFDVVKIISSYITKHNMKLLDCINQDEISCWNGLSINPNAIDLLEANQDKIEVLYDYLTGYYPD